MKNYDKLLNDLLKGPGPQDKYEFQLYQLNKLMLLEIENEALKKKIHKMETPGIGCPF